jgi:uncharacterized membrane protein YczE
LAIGGFALTLFVKAGFGLDPWDVLHQGISRRTGASLGTVVVLSSGAVLTLWIPLRQRPGFGTLADVVVIGVVIDATLPLVPEPTTLAPRILALVTALLLNGLSTSMYIGAGMGPGPRDGLMTGLAARGHSIRIVRTGIDVSVLSVGWLLGGTVGVGTLASAMTLGPIVHLLLPKFAASVDNRAPRRHRRSVGRAATVTPAC